MKELESYSELGFSLSLWYTALANGPTLSGSLNAK
jgi:hypothetical protein